MSIIKNVISYATFASMLLCLSALAQEQRGDEVVLTVGSYKRAAKIVSPSVVFIKVRMPLQFSAGREQRLEGSEATGSGIIKSRDGHVITNKHVVNNGRILDCKVTLADGREFDAVLVGIAPDTDIAVIRLTSPPSDLVPADFGDPSVLEPGDPVIAVGSPLGLKNTVTHGIISAIRSEGGYVERGAPTHKMIQTDASINPGNSGGALATLQGKVIGVNTLIFTTSGGSVGLGFSIPIDIAVKAFERIVSGNTELGWIGIGVDTLSETNRRAFGLPQTAKGVLVTKVDAQGPSGGKLRQGDCITALNGTPVTDAVQFRGMIKQLAPKSTITLTVHRGSAEPRDIPLTVAAMPPER